MVQFAQISIGFMGYGRSPRISADVSYRYGTEKEGQR